MIVQIFDFQLKPKKFWGNSVEIFCMTSWKYTLQAIFSASHIEHLITLIIGFQKYLQ